MYLLRYGSLDRSSDAEALGFCCCLRRFEETEGHLTAMLFGRVSRFLGTLTWPYRLATWRRRALPDFIVIGAQKSGTTSLYFYLTQHPQLLPALTKEVHFFDGGLNPNVDTFRKGEGWYRAQFPLTEDLRGGRRTFEASPLYLFNPLAPGRMFDLVPKVKIIALLRDPTERAISHYFHERRLGREPLPIYEALLEEERRLEPVLASADYKSHAFIHYSYKRRGLYKEQLERYLRYFSWQQLLVLSSEEFFADPVGTLGRVFAFVGVDRGSSVRDLSPRNTAGAQRPVEPRVREYLHEYFRTHNTDLFHFVGRDFGWPASVTDTEEFGRRRR